MRRGFVLTLAASVVLVSAGLVCAGGKVVLGKDAWSGFMLVGYNPYGNKKSFY